VQRLGERCSGDVTEKTMMRMFDPFFAVTLT
jgi:hypothetical protein